MRPVPGPADCGRHEAGELRVGFIIGPTSERLSFPSFGSHSVTLVLHSGFIGALLVAGSVAISIRFLLPWTFFHLGKDPAFDSGPLATIFQNVPVFIVYYFTFSLIV